MLENSKPTGVSEIILSNDGNRLLEGLVTNFFVVSRNSEATVPNIPEKWRDVEVQTAALADGVLPGVIRQLVIEVCRENGIPLREMAPSWESRGTWQEAFVTSGLRILQPVGSIQRPNSEHWNIDSEIMKTCEFTKFQFENLGHVTEHIRKFVLQRIGDEKIPVQRFLSQTCTG
jgi:branched-subunit amino acid aminotransferase/4-amino-4-deoxychorismate lyase